MSAKNVSTTISLRFYIPPLIQHSNWLLNNSTNLTSLRQYYQNQPPQQQQGGYYPPQGQGGYGGPQGGYGGPQGGYGGPQGGYGGPQGGYGGPQQGGYGGQRMSNRWDGSCRWVVVVLMCFVVFDFLAVDRYSTLWKTPDQSKSTCTDRCCTDLPPRSSFQNLPIRPLHNSISDSFPMLSMEFDHQIPWKWLWMEMWGSNSIQTNRIRRLSTATTATGMSDLTVRLPQYKDGELIDPSCFLLSYPILPLLNLFDVILRILPSTRQIRRFTIYPMREYLHQSLAMIVDVCPSTTTEKEWRWRRVYGLSSGWVMHGNPRLDRFADLCFLDFYHFSSVLKYRVILRITGWVLHFDIHSSRHKIPLKLMYQSLYPCFVFPTNYSIWLSAAESVIQFTTLLSRSSCMLIWSPFCNMNRRYVVAAYAKHPSLWWLLWNLRGTDSVFPLLSCWMFSMNESDVIGRRSVSHLVV